MVLLRLIGILGAVAIAVALVLYIVTGDRGYLRFALRALKWAVAIALVFFGLLLLQRLTTML